MRYSVYDYTRRAYDYYEAAGPKGTHAGSPPAVRPIPGASKGAQLGASPDHATWKLPAGARKVGTGEKPEGRIASLAGADVFSDPMRIATYAVIAYAIWRMTR